MTYLLHVGPRLGVWRLASLAAPITALPVVVWLGWQLVHSGRFSVLDDVLAWSPTALVVSVGILFRRCARHAAAALTRCRILDGEIPVDQWDADSAEKRMLGCLARFLPATARLRFVAEERGNLDSCERRWQRVRWLAGLTIGLPRLAWMMYRENRRGRAE